MCLRGEKISGRNDYIMTERDRVIAALNFSKPDRVPRDLWVLSYIEIFHKEKLDKLLEKYPGDIEKATENALAADAKLERLSKIGPYTDDWGSVWYVGEPGVIGEVKEPALPDWSKLDKYQPPWDLIKNRDIDFINRTCDKSDKFMISDISARPFERIQFVRGSENVYLDLAYDSKEFRKLLEMIHEFFLKDVTNWAESNVDAVFLMDDWGGNDSLLISPAMWRTMFKPLYKEYCDIIHKAGKYVFYHVDGFIEPIFGDLIEVGMDAINSQLFCMNIESLAEKYKGKVTFWGEIDRQRILSFGTTDEVHQAVQRVRNALDDDSGGVIAQCEWGTNDPQENIEAVLEAWL